MELVEIKGLFDMDCGAPSPFIIASGAKLFVTFYGDEDIISVAFNVCIKHTFGFPGNETIHWHPYYKLGMDACSFYELKDSDLIKELMEIDKGHAYHNPERWKEYKHYILTFHDNMLECVAEKFEIRKTKTSLHQQITTVFNEMLVEA